MPGKNTCTKCNKGGIIMLCDRCQHTYCDQHINEHRQQFPHQLDDIDREYNFIREELRQTTNRHSLFNDIDKWERESIIKIQKTAEIAREQLRQMVEDSKERLLTSSGEIIEELHSSREIGNFCENDLIRSIQQLKQLQTKISSPLTVHLVEDKKSIIHLITVKGIDFQNQSLEKAKVYSVTKRTLTSDIQEQFSKHIGPAKITDYGLLVKHTGPNLTFAYILGEQLYSQGRQTIRFKIEHCRTPYNIFFGCISSQVHPDKIHYKSLVTAGWFGHNEAYEHGTCNTNVQMHGYDSDKIEQYDILSLTFDCDEKLIEFYPERTKKIHELSIDLNKAPLPWRLLIALTYENDSIRILYA